MTKEQIEKVESEAYYLFKRLSRAVEEEVGCVPTRDRLLGCPAYLEVIGMGKESLPWIFGELRRSNKDFNILTKIWDLALTSITRDRFGTSFDLHAKRFNWLRWADRNGYAENMSAPTQPDAMEWVEVSVKTTN